MLSEQSHCDFDPSKKAKYFDMETEKVACEENKAKLKKPVEIPNKQDK